VTTARQFLAISFFVFSQFLSQPGQAQSVTVVTDPAGFYLFAMPSNSDTIVSIPFTRPADFVGQIASVTGNVISVAGSVNWSSNQYVYSAGIQSNAYYVFINTGPGAGIHYPITNNTANSLNLDLGGGESDQCQRRRQPGNHSVLDFGYGPAAGEGDSRFADTRDSRHGNIDSRSRGSRDQSQRQPGVLPLEWKLAVSRSGGGGGG